MNIGDKIRSARINKGMTQEELGKLLGVQRGAINKYEKGVVVNIKRSTLQRISEILEIRPSELIFEEEINNDPVGTAELHFEILMDEDIKDIFEDFKTLDATQRRIVKDLVHNMAEAKKTEA